MKLLLLFINYFIFLLIPTDERSAESGCVTPVQKRATASVAAPTGQFVRIVFYNAENLYDPHDDSLRMDEEFTPDGAKGWSYSRFQTKLNHLSKTLIAIGSWEPPAIVGLCEVENLYVLNRLIHQTPLKRYGYRIIHKDSPDMRGIDVAVIYRPDTFTLISSEYHSLRFPEDSSARTRDILMVKGVVFGADTIILFINHWPSRRGGYAASQPRRNFAASLLRSKADSLLSSDHDPKIIITGDFNDEPDGESLAEILKAKPHVGKAAPKDLINLMYSDKIRWDEGTIRFQGKWSVFDQFIVTGNLVMHPDIRGMIHAEAHIFRAEFLMMKDERNLGDELKRTYSGPRYLGGFSDHLPVYLDVIKNAK